MRSAVFLTLVMMACGGGDAQPQTQVAATAQPLPGPPAPPTATAAATASAAPSSAPDDGVATGEESDFSGGVVDAGTAGVLGLQSFDGGVFATLSVGDAGGAWSSGVGSGYGRGHGRLGGHPAVTVRQGTTTVNGRLPPEVIRRIVRQNYARFRACYEHGLRQDPTLAGRVAIKFVIGPNGDVTSASDGGSALSNADVIACVRARFQSLMFPKPERGIVTVVYPLIFASSP